MDQLLPPGLVERARHLRLLEMLSRVFIDEYLDDETWVRCRKLVIREYVSTKSVSVKKSKIQSNGNVDCSFIGVYMSISAGTCSILMPYVSADLETLPSLQDLCLQHMLIDTPKLQDHLWVYYHDPVMDKHYFRMLFESSNGKLRMVAVEYDRQEIFDASEFVTWQEAYIEASHAITEYTLSHNRTCLTIEVHVGKRISYYFYLERFLIEPVSLCIHNE